MALVTRAIRSGIYNDLGSGSNVDLCIITKDGAEYLRNHEYLQVGARGRQGRGSSLGAPGQGVQPGARQGSAWSLGARAVRGAWAPGQCVEPGRARAVRGAWATGQGVEPGCQGRGSSLGARLTGAAGPGPGSCQASGDGWAAGEGWASGGAARQPPKPGWVLVQRGACSRAPAQGSGLTSARALDVRLRRAPVPCPAPDWLAGRCGCRARPTHGPSQWSTPRALHVSETAPAGVVAGDVAWLLLLRLLLHACRCVAAVKRCAPWVPPPRQLP
jgi:hypothetical protein